MKRLTGHDLNRNFNHLIKKEDTLFDYILEGFLDCMLYINLEVIEDEWLSPRFLEVLGYELNSERHKSLGWQDIIFKDDFKKLVEIVENNIENPNYAFVDISN